MSTNLAASPQAYRESAVLTASPERLVVMLYDGVRRFLLQAAAAMRAGDVPVAHERLRRGEAIVEHLLATLDMSQGEVAEQLVDLVELAGVLLHAALREEALAEDVDRLQPLGELREAWAQLADSPQAALQAATA